MWKFKFKNHIAIGNNTCLKIDKMWPQPVRGNIFRAYLFLVLAVLARRTFTIPLRLIGKRFVEQNLEKLNIKYFQNKNNRAESYEI